MKSDVNPMHPAERLQKAIRCSARSKRSGKPCRAPAVRGWNVCRMHGAGGGGKAGPESPNWQHGMRSREYRALRKLATALCRDVIDFKEALGGD